MLKRVFKEHKKLCILSGVIVFILIVVYFHAMFLPGIWFRETFLYRQSDGSYTGSDYNADYQMYITRTEDGADIDFSVNGNKKQYRIFHNNGNSNIQIYENEELVFTGSGIPQGDSWYLLVDEEGKCPDDMEFTISMSDTVAEVDLFPAKGWLYTWTVAEKDDIRGNPEMIIVILFCAVVLFLDIKFPDLFFILNYRLSVKGGEPSDWYRATQSVGRVLLVIGILVCMGLSFMVP